MNGNITTAPLGGNRNIKTKPLFQYDYGQVLKIIGVTLPAAYEVHFSNQLHGVATTQIGNADGVIIPDIYLTTGEPVYAWIYLHTGNSDGETEYTITIPVVRRASISDAEPTPVQQDVITQAIAALNTAVEQTAQDVQDATEAKQDAEEAAGEAYESAVAAAQSATNAGTYAGQAQTAQAASELAQQKAEEAQLDAQAAQWAAESAQTAAEAAQAGAVAARTGAETAQAWAVAARSGAETAQHAAEAARDEITGLSATATTLPAGSDATASYSDGLLTIGVPKGEKGDTGDTGATPDLTIGTVQTLPAGSSATASITGTAEDPVLNLGIPKGDTGEVTQAEFDALADDVSDMQDTIEHKADIDGYYTDMTVGAAEQVVSSTMVEDNAPYKLRTSGGSTDIGNRAYVDKIVGGTVAWNQQVRDAASENVTEYADVVAVTDAVEDDAAVSVQVEPVQDLHGYDSPWPAGGGKNKFHFSAGREGYEWSDGCGFSAINVDDYFVTLYGTASESHTFSVTGATITLKAGTYKLSTSTNTIMFTLLKASDLSNLGNSYGGAFTLAEDTECIFNIITISGSAYGTSTTVYIQIESGDTATEIVPYSNLCPISGWDEVNITQSGANLLPTYTESVTQNGITYTANADGSVTVNGTATATNTYTASWGTWAWDGAQDAWLSGCPAGGNYGNGYSLRVDAQGGGWSNPDTGNGIKLEDYGTTTNIIGRNLKFCIVVRSGTVCDNLVFKPMLNFGISALPYAQYQPFTTYTITLPQTVYNATVGSDGGESRTATVTLDGNTPTNVLSITQLQDYTQVSYTPYISVGVAGHNFISSTLKSGSADGLYRIWGSSVPRLFIGLPTSVTNAAQAVAWFAENPTQIVYPLATPTQFSITPPQITTLLGTNHVWSDAGQVALTYTGTDEHLVLTTGRKYLTRINGTDSMVLGAGQEVTAVKGMDNVFDLTQMLGTSVADYVYQQGANYFRKWFGGTRYAYNAGELISVQGVQSRDVVGFNQWDSSTDNIGKSIAANGDLQNSTNYAASDYIRVLPNTTYYLKNVAPSANARTVYCYDAVKNPIRDLGLSGTQNVPASGLITTLDNTHYVRIVRFATTTEYGINLSHNASRNGEYEPYTHRSYPLDSTLTLRGIPKVGTDGVYWDGDEYGYDGGVKRRYGVVDMGTLNWYRVSATYPYFAATNSDLFFSGQTTINAKYANTDAMGGTDFGGISTDKCFSHGISSNGTYIKIRDNSYADAASFKAAMSGVYLVYKLATPTTETAQPYQQIQHVDDWGTEELVSGTITPVGHVTRYPANLRDKLQHLPALASANGSYIITQTDGQMVLSPFPAPPTAAGNYLLKATVSGGNATYSWVAQ